MGKLENTDQLIAAVVDALENIKGEEIKVLDLRDIENAVCKYFIVCSGSSNTQVNALAGSVQKRLVNHFEKSHIRLRGQFLQNGFFWIILILLFIFFKNH